MHLWIIKDTFFGYQYTANKKYRKLIFEYFEYIYKVLNTKGKNDDCFIISSGLFSNTNPTIIAINDAITLVKKISTLMPVYIIDSKIDNRKFDNEYYTTIDMLHDIDNVNLIKNKSDIGDIFLIPTDIPNTENKAIISDKNELKLDDLVISIPSAIQFTDKITNIGLLVYDVNRNKHILLKDKELPKHIKKQINTFEELESVTNDTIDYIHLTIDFKLKSDNETKLNILLSKLNPHSIEFKNEVVVKKRKQVYNMGDISIVDIVKKEIKDDDVYEQFERILKINK